MLSSFPTWEEEMNRDRHFWYLFASCVSSDMHSRVECLYPSTKKCCSSTAQGLRTSIPWQFQCRNKNSSPTKPNKILLFATEFTTTCQKPSLSDLIAWLEGNLWRLPVSMTSQTRACTGSCPVTCWVSSRTEIPPWATIPLQNHYHCEKPLSLPWTRLLEHPYLQGTFSNTRQLKRNKIFESVTALLSWVFTLCPASAWAFRILLLRSAGSHFAATIGLSIALLRHLSVNFTTSS